MSNSDAASSVNPITTRGTDYGHPITASPPGFENLAASLSKPFFQILCASQKVRTLTITKTRHIYSSL